MRLKHEVILLQKYVQIDQCKTVENKLHYNQFANRMHHFKEMYFDLPMPFSFILQNNCYFNMLG